jgi:hypothetical protein
MTNTPSVSEHSLAKMYTVPLEKEIIRPLHLLAKLKFYCLILFFLEHNNESGSNHLFFLFQIGKEGK